MRRELARFDCATVAEAQAIILTAEPGIGTQERWECETAWLKPRLDFGSGTIIDLGCGIGRLAKEIVGPARPVIGVDVSPTMRAQAREYVGSEYFVAVSRGEFDDLVRDGLRVQGALAVWILQHVADPRTDLAALAAVLEPGAPLYVVNLCQRRVPVGDWQWQDDGIQLVPLLSIDFDLEKAEVMPPQLCGTGAYFSRWRRKQETGATNFF